MWSQTFGAHWSLNAFALYPCTVVLRTTGDCDNMTISHKAKCCVHLELYGVLTLQWPYALANFAQLVNVWIMKWCHIRCEGLLGSVGCSRALSAESSCACGRNFGQRALSIGCTRELARRSSTVMNVDLSALFCSGIICHAEVAILTPEKCDRALTAWSFCSVH